MNLPRFFRPKHQHPDAAVRLAAVATLDDQELLAQLVASDEDAEVRAAALARIVRQELRAEIAKGTDPLNVRALERITEPRLLSSIAHHAASVEVRRLAVAQVDDAAALAAIAAQDPDPSVRQQARLKHRAADRVHQYLKEALARLEVTNIAEPVTDASSGSLDEVCGALMQDCRFQVDAVAAEPEPATTAGGNAAATAAAPNRPGGYVELIAHDRNQAQAAATRAHVVHFQIRIWRRAENRFEWRMAERRAELTNDVESWAASSNG